jgi:hypothetical protein
VVGSQTGNLTPSLSFGHNLRFRCPNEQCEPTLNIYILRAFQWYEEHHKPLNFDPSNCSLKFWESTGTPSPKVGVALGMWVFTPSHSLTFSYTPGNMWCDSRLPLGPQPCNAFALTPGLPSSWLTTLQPLCLGHEPKARVATIMITKHILVTIMSVHDHHQKIISHIMWSKKWPSWIQERKKLAIPYINSKCST